MTYSVTYPAGTAPKPVGPEPPGTGSRDTLIWSLAALAVLGLGVLLHTAARRGGRRG